MKEVIGIIHNDRELFLSLKRAMCLFFDNTDYYDFSLLQKTDFNNVSDEKVLSKKEKRRTMVIGTNAIMDKKIDFKCHLINCRLILFTSFEVSAFQIIRMVHYLRTDLNWEGRFLAIVGSVTEEELLMKSDIFGEKEGRYLFGRIPGHGVIYYPFFLKDLSLIVHGMQDMYLEGWKNLVDLSIINKVVEEINKVNELLAKNDKQQDTISIINEIFRKLKKVDWDIVLENHSDARLMRQIIEEYTTTGSLTKLIDYSLVIKKVDQILSKSCIGISREI